MVGGSADEAARKVAAIAATAEVVVDARSLEEDLVDPDRGGGERATSGPGTVSITVLSWIESAMKKMRNPSPRQLWNEKEHEKEHTS